MASSWDCASALSPQSGKVAAKSNHMVTLRRCEEVRRPLEDSEAEKTRFTQQGWDLTFPKGIYQIRQMFWADVFGAPSSDVRPDEQQRNRLNQLAAAAGPSVRRPSRRSSIGRKTNSSSGMTGKMAPDSRITRLSALQVNFGTSVSQCWNVHPPSDSNS